MTVSPTAADLGDLAVGALAATVVGILPPAQAPGGELHDAEREVWRRGATARLWSWETHPSGHVQPKPKHARKRGKRV